MPRCLSRSDRTAPAGGLSVPSPRLVAAPAAGSHPKSSGCLDWIGPRALNPLPNRIARVFGVIMIALIAGWDIDAMRPHIAVHSWGTLAFVTLFLVVHVGDYLTVGRLIHRFDPALLTASNVKLTAISATLAVEPRRLLAAAAAAFRSLSGIVIRLWLAAFVGAPMPSCIPRPTPARVYAFPVASQQLAQASGGSCVVSA